MTRFESSAWPLAGGSLNAFAVAVVLGHVPWPYPLGTLVVVVAVWSWCVPLLVSVALGGIAWAFLTGFDLNLYGHLAITGPGDAARAALLVAAAAGGAVAGRLWTSRAGTYPDPYAPDVPPAALRPAGAHSGPYRVAASQPDRAERGAERVTTAGVHGSLEVSDDRYRRPVRVPK